MPSYYMSKSVGSFPAAKPALSIYFTKLFSIWCLNSMQANILKIDDNGIAINHTRYTRVLLCASAHEEELDLMKKRVW